MPAAYDIIQKLIHYEKLMSHGCSALVDITKTFLLFFLSCAIAIFISVLVRVLRLSKSWMVRELMTVYKKGFRNVPFLLWIVLVFAVLAEGVPQPSTFRGDNIMLLSECICLTRSL